MLWVSSGACFCGGGVPLGALICALFCVAMRAAVRVQRAGLFCAAMRAAVRVLPAGLYCVAMRAAVCVQRAGLWSVSVLYSAVCSRVCCCLCAAHWPVVCFSAV